MVRFPPLSLYPLGNIPPLCLGARMGPELVGTFCRGENSLFWESNPYSLVIQPTDRVLRALRYWLLNEVRGDVLVIISEGT
jgi:hypothetical protein